MCARRLWSSWVALAAAVCAACWAAPGWAQSFDLGGGREAVVSLDGLWRFHPGDSPLDAVTHAPLWAAPGFDDTAWPLLRSNEPFSGQGYSGMSGFAWYRFRVEIPAGEGPVSLMLAPVLTSYQLYVDGRLAGECGRMAGPAVMLSAYMNYRIYPLTPPLAPLARPLTLVTGAGLRTVEVALRVWHSPLWAGYVGGGPFRGGHLAGDPAILAAEQQHYSAARAGRFVDAYSYSIIAALVGLAILWLFLMQPAEREYLWFALMLLAEAADSALNVGQSIFFWPPIPIYDLTDGILVGLEIGATLCFFARVLEFPPGRAGRVALGLVIASPLAAVLYWPGWAPVPTSASIQIVCLLPAVAWFLGALIWRAWRGNLDARLLLVPTLLVWGFYFADNLAIVLAQAGITHRPRIFEAQLPLPPFTVETGTLLHLIFLLALLVFLIRRFALARQREQRLAQEFEAARQVQQVLLPEELDQCPGFAVESVYQPAEQVGGDFFQQLADGAGGMLIVIGDVSGKGLPAAMTVSMLVGAIRTEAEHMAGPGTQNGVGNGVGNGAGPAEMLACLNGRMMGRLREGFATCLAAHLTADGRLTIANAGHLPPYLNGEEIAVPGSLPLGIANEDSYETATLQLAPGDRLTFVSDGVVEAQSRTGELLGFERTRTMSRKPAAEIAAAARAFGQSDDITVVTVEFTGAPVAAAAVTAN